MSCANWVLSIAGIAILVFSIFNIVSLGATRWIMIIAGIVVLITAWTGVRCKWCEDMPKTKRK